MHDLLTHGCLPAALLVAAAVTFAGRDAHAEEPHARTSSLSWVRLPGAESCVPTQDLAQRVEARLGRAVFVSAAQADVSVEGHIEPAPLHRGGFRAVLTLRDAHGAALGTRELTRPEASCDAMREPLALVIAVMIDPDASLAPPPAAATAPPASTPEPPAPVVIEKPVYIPVIAPPAKPKPTWSGDFGASFAAMAGIVPTFGLGVFANGLIEPPGLFPFEGFGAVWFDDRASNGGVSVSFYELGGGLCLLHYESARVHVVGCGLGEIGLMTGTFNGQSHGAPYLGLAPEARVSLRLVGPFALRAGVSAMVAVLRPDFAGLFESSVIGGRADVGLGALFP